MSESSLTWMFDPPEADKCLLASGEFDVHFFQPRFSGALREQQIESPFIIQSLSVLALIFNYPFQTYLVSLICIARNVS